MGLQGTAEARRFYEIESVNEAACSEAWSRSCSRAAMIITPSLHLLWSNDEGRRLLDIDRDLGEVGGRLSFAQRTGRLVRHGEPDAPPSKVQLDQGRAPYMDLNFLSGLLHFRCLHSSSSD